MLLVQQTDRRLITCNKQQHSMSACLLFGIIGPSPPICTACVKLLVARETAEQDAEVYGNGNIQYQHLAVSTLVRQWRH